jgi:2-iminobutanoate/2-iminopropanoate deaminase
MTEVRTGQAPEPAGPYSQAISANGIVFASGQRPVEPATGEIPEGLTLQAERVLANLREVLSAGGCSLADVVKVTAYLSDLSGFEEFNAVYRRFFSPPYPARTTVGAQLRGILVEVDAIAVKPEAR